MDAPSYTNYLSNVAIAKLTNSNVFFLKAFLRVTLAHVEVKVTELISAGIVWVLREIALVICCFLLPLR